MEFEVSGFGVEVALRDLGRMSIWGLRLQFLGCSIEVFGFGGFRDLRTYSGELCSMNEGSQGLGLLNGQSQCTSY